MGDVHRELHQAIVYDVILQWEDVKKVTRQQWRSYSRYIQLSKAR